MIPQEFKAMQDEVARLTAENEALKNPAKKERSLSCKVSDKGALSVYGLGRFPVTLYKGQWLKLFAVVDSIKQFIADHDAELAVKPGQKIVSNEDAVKIASITNIGGNDAA